MGRRLLVVVAVAAGLLLAAGPARAGTVEGAAWRWPLAAPVTVVRGFDPPQDAWAAGHRGVDLLGRPGEPVFAAGAGTVEFAGRIAGVGVVSVRHGDGLVTTYQPVRPAVVAGEVVTAGRRIGVLVVAGSHCPPRACLHWGLRRDGGYLDPLGLLGLGRVRLLPLPPGRGGSWVVPAVSGASIGSSSTVVAWAVAVQRRRRRRLPPGVASLACARRRRLAVPARADPA